MRLVWSSTPAAVASEFPVGIKMKIFEVGVDGMFEKFEICHRDRRSWSMETFATHVKTFEKTNKAEWPNSNLVYRRDLRDKFKLF